MILACHCYICISFQYADKNLLDLKCLPPFANITNVGADVKLM